MLRLLAENVKYDSQLLKFIFGILMLFFIFCFGNLDSDGQTG